MSPNLLGPLVSNTPIPAATQTATGNLPPLTNPVTSSGTLIDLSFVFFAVAFESLLYGIFIVLTFTALYLWFDRFHNMFIGRQSPEDKSIKVWLRWISMCLKNPLVFGSLVLFLVILGHWTCAVGRVIQAAEIIRLGSSPEPFYEDLSHPTFVLMSALVTISVATADALLIWRLWVLSQRSLWVILPPSVIVVGFFACGIRATAWFSTAAPPYHIFSQEIHPWILCNVILTAISNLYCSGFLTFYINRIGSKSKVRSKAILTTVIDSAAIHSIWSVFTLVAYQTHSKLALLALDAGPVMAGIAFMFINVRVGLGWDIRSPYEMDTSGSSTMTLAPLQTHESRDRSLPAQASTSLKPPEPV